MEIVISNFLRLAKFQNPNLFGVQRQKKMPKVFFKKKKHRHVKSDLLYFEDKHEYIGG